MKKLLITGAAGIVGTRLRPRLAADFELVLMDVEPVSNLAPNERFLAGSIVDKEAISGAAKGVDAILHLACLHALTIGFEDTLEVNYRGTLNVLDAAVANNVGTVVFASSGHGWGFYTRSEAPVKDTAPVRPDGWYAISKIWGEAVLAYYADAYGLSTTSLRIGNANGEVVDERRLHMWISFGDLAALVRRALEAPAASHRAVFAVGDCPAPFYDNAGVKKLGDSPKDVPEDHLKTPDIADDTPPDSIEGLALGGPFAAANFAADAEVWKKTRKP